MKKSILFILAAISFTAVKAQQIPLYTQYYNNEFLYNPSQTLTEDYSSLSMLYRQQWISSESPLTTQGMVFQTPLKVKKIGLGVSLINDKYGIFNRTGGSMAYSYQVDLNYDHKLIFGLAAGFLTTNYEWNQDVTILADPRFQEAITDRITTFDANFGFTYKWKELEVGVAVPHLLDQDILTAAEADNSLYFNSRHFVGSASYQFRLSDDKIGIRPLALVRYQPAVNPLLDFSAVFDYQEKVWAAVGYRYEGAMTFGAGVNLHDRLNIGYSYDMNLNSDLNQHFGATHEINLTVRFGRTEPKAIDKDPWEREEKEDVITLEDLQKEIEKLKKANKNQDSTITDHEERIKALENQVKRDSLEKVMKEILTEMKVGSGSIDLRGDNLSITGKTRAIVSPEDEEGNIWGYKDDGTAIKPFDKYDGKVYKDKNGEDEVLNPKKGAAVYDEDGNLIDDLNNYTGRIKNKNGEYIKDKNGNFIYYNNEGLEDNINSGGFNNGGNNGGNNGYNNGGNNGGNNGYNNGGNNNGGNNGGNNNGNNGTNNSNRSGSTGSSLKTYGPDELLDDGIRYTAPGNYVVVGSFRSKDYAIKMREELQEKGYSAGIVYNHFRKWFYVYAHESKDFDETMQLLRKEQTGSHKDSWVHVIIE